MALKIAPSLAGLFCFTKEYNTSSYTLHTLFTFLTRLLSTLPSFPFDNLLRPASVRFDYS